MARIVKDLGAATAYAYAKEKGYTGTEDEFAELMASYADVAEQAAESAKQAGASATAAEQAKANAVSSASAAATSASTASTKASEAAASASSASGSANTATTKASEASTSATNAVSSASAAASSATNAGASETAAASSATAASNAQTAAETAQGKAEDAQTAAENAAASVSESAAQITQNTEDIDDLKSALSDTEDLILNWSSKTFNASDGVIDVATGQILPSSASKQTKFNCAEYKAIEFTTSAYNSAYGYVFLDGNDNVLLGKKTTASDRVRVFVPSGAEQFRTCWKGTDTQSINVAMSTKFEDILIAGEVEIAESSVFEKGYYLASNGVKAQGTNGDRYGKYLIPVKPQDIVIYHGKTSNTINGDTFTQWWAYGLYDSNGDFISRKTVSGDSSEPGFFVVNKEIEIPGGAYFIRLSYTAGDTYEEIGLRKRICSHTSPEIPSYYFANNYLYDKANRIETVAKEDAANGDVFFFITDQHWTINERHSVDIINWLAKRCNIPRCFNGGDIADYGAYVGGVLAIKDYATKLRNAFDGEIYHVVGNHEYHSNATGSELYYLLDMFNNNQIGNNDRHYWYVDNPQEKLRYVILSAFQHDDKTPSVKTGYEQDQVNWLRDVALDVASGWGVIVFTHFLKADTTLSSSVINVLDQYDGNGEIIAVIGGHTHCDYHTTTNSGIPVISVTCDKNQPWISGGVNMEPYLNDRVAGTIKEQAFDVIVVNRTNKTLTQIRIGCPIREGTDPETWTEEEEVVTSYDRT